MSCCEHALILARERAAEAERQPRPGTATPHAPMPAQAALPAAVPAAGALTFCRQWLAKVVPAIRSE